jgi:hypothetical protein
VGIGFALRICSGVQYDSAACAANVAICPAKAGSETGPSWLRESALPVSSDTGPVCDCACANAIADDNPTRTTALEYCIITSLIE